MDRLQRLLKILAESSELEEASLRAGYNDPEQARGELAALAAGIDSRQNGPVCRPDRPVNDIPRGTGEADLIVNTDGAARGNPGPAAAAAVVFDRAGSEIYSKAIRLGRATNNEAEYRGLILGLDLARDLGGREILVRMDSELVVKQMNGEYKIKKEHLRELAGEAGEKALHFDSVRYQHVPRAENSKADKLAGDLLDSED